MTDPTTAQQLAQAEQLLASGQRSEAYTIAKQITTADPLNAHAWYLLSQATEDAQEAAIAREREAQSKPIYTQRLNAGQFQSLVQPQKKSWKARAKWIAIGSVVIVCSCMAFLSNLGQKVQAEQTATAVEALRIQNLTATTSQQTSVAQSNATATVQSGLNQTSTAIANATLTHVAQVNATATAVQQAMIQATTDTKATATAEQQAIVKATADAKATETAVFKEIAAATQAALPTNTPVPSQTPAELLAVQLERTMAKSNRNLQRIQSTLMNGTSLEIDWTINDNITEDLIKYSAKKDIFNMLRFIHGYDLEYEQIRLRGSFPLLDAFGNSEEQYVVVVIYNRSTVDEINYQRFIVDNMYIIADDIFIAPAFQD